MGNAFSGRSVRRQLGTEDIPRTNPAEIFNSFKDQFGDSQVFHRLVTYLDANSLASFACTNRSIYGKISADYALMNKIASRTKSSTNTSKLASTNDASSYWSNIQQQYSSQNSARISPENIASIASVITNEISLSYSLQQQSQKYDWYTRSGKFEDVRATPARVSSPYSVPSSITEDDRTKLKELYENGFIQKEEMLSRLAILH